MQNEIFPKCANPECNKRVSKINLIYCGRQCYMKHKKADIPKCANPECNNKAGRKGRRYCGLECSMKDRLKQRDLKIKKHPRFCKRCGKPILKNTRDSWETYIGRKYCSRLCNFRAKSNDKPKNKQPAQQKKQAPKKRELQRTKTLVDKSNKDYKKITREFLQRKVDEFLRPLNKGGLGGKITIIDPADSQRVQVLDYSETASDFLME